MIVQTRETAFVTRAPTRFSRNQIMLPESRSPRCSCGATSPPAPIRSHFYHFRNENWGQSQTLSCLAVKRITNEYWKTIAEMNGNCSTLPPVSLLSALSHAQCREKKKVLVCCTTTLLLRATSSQGANSVKYVERQRDDRLAAGFGWCAATFTLLFWRAWLSPHGNFIWQGGRNG